MRTKRRLMTQQQENWTTVGSQGNNSLEQQGSKCSNHSCWKPTNCRRSIVLCNVAHNQLTFWPDEDLQLAVETSQFTSQVCETNNSIENWHVCLTLVAITIIVKPLSCIWLQKISPWKALAIYSNANLDSTFTTKSNFNFQIHCD